MSNKRFKEMKSLSTSELVIKAKELQAKVFEAKLKKATAQLADTAVLWRMRKDIARIKTIQSQVAAGQGSK